MYNLNILLYTIQLLLYNIIYIECFDLVEARMDLFLGYLLAMYYLSIFTNETICNVMHFNIIYIEINYCYQNPNKVSLSRSFIVLLAYYIFAEKSKCLSNFFLICIVMSNLLIQICLLFKIGRRKRNTFSKGLRTIWSPTTKSQVLAQLRVSQIVCYYKVYHLSI